MSHASLGSSLCQCFCGGGSSDVQNPEFDTLGYGADDELPLKVRQVTGLLSYSTSPDQCLRGNPVHEGTLWYFRTSGPDCQEPTVWLEPVTLLLYVNGFSLVHSSQDLQSVVLSPFSLVRKSRFQHEPAGAISDCKVFRILIFRQCQSFCFGAQGAHAEEERSSWILAISSTIRSLTQSLFPDFSISCEPLDSNAATHRRLMAGYLLHFEHVSTSSVLYCELHPHEDDQAKLVLYENELCQTPMLDIYISERSICCEKNGASCSCFVLEDHEFSARTLAERKLWLRAISNLQVKIQNQAPSPTAEELEEYRRAVKEQVDALGLVLASRSSGALLELNVGLPWQMADPYMDIGYLGFEGNKDFMKPCNGPFHDSKFHEIDLSSSATEHWADDVSELTPRSGILRV